MHALYGTSLAFTGETRPNTFTIFQDPSKLHLRSFITAAQPLRQETTLCFPQALLPHVALDTSHVYAVTCGGFLHSIQLPESQHAAAAAGQQPTDVSCTFTSLTAGTLMRGLSTVRIKSACGNLTMVALSPM